MRYELLGDHVVGVPRDPTHPNHTKRFVWPAPSIYPLDEDGQEMRVVHSINRRHARLKKRGEL